jgi:hypothetical protein
MTHNHIPLLPTTPTPPYKHLHEFDADIQSPQYSLDSEDGRQFRALVNARLAKSQPYIMPGIYASAKRNLWLAKDGLQ